MFWFRAYKSETRYHTPCKAEISEKIGKLGILILDGEKPVDYVKNLEKAMEKAHTYLFKNIEKEILSKHSSVYYNLLDMTQVSQEKFKLTKPT